MDFVHEKKTLEYDPIVQTIISANASSSAEFVNSGIGRTIVLLNDLFEQIKDVPKLAEQLESVDSEEYKANFFLVSASSILIRVCSAASKEVSALINHINVNQDQISHGETATSEIARQISHTLRHFQDSAHDVAVNLSNYLRERARLLATDGSVNEEAARVAVANTDLQHHTDIIHNLIAVRNNLAFIHVEIKKHEHYIFPK